MVLCRERNPRTAPEKARMELRTSVEFHMDTKYNLKLLNVCFLFAFCLNRTCFGFSVVTLGTLSLKGHWLGERFLEGRGLKK